MNYNIYNVHKVTQLLCKLLSMLSSASLWWRGLSLHAAQRECI